MSGLRKILVIEYDVTSLTPKQIAVLMQEAVVQGEASDLYDAQDEDDGHPDVPVITTKVVERPSIASRAGRKA